jgi:hypothetical protein
MGCVSSSLHAKQMIVQAWLQLVLDQTGRRTKHGEGGVVIAVVWLQWVIQRQADAVAEDEQHDEELKV